MPRFDFKCPNCGTVVEEGTPDAEPTCGICLPATFTSITMKRVYDFAGIQFVGPGFYKNDSKPYTEEHGKRYWH